MTEAELADDIALAHKLLCMLMFVAKQRLPIADTYHLEAAVRVLERLADRVEP